MAYDTNTITAKGAELLAAATAADKLILDGCDATTTYLDAATAAAVSSRPATPFSNTTEVSIIGYTSSHVQARAAFIAGSSTGGDVNTLYLYGHKQSAPSDIFVIYVASSQDSFHLPEVGDVANVYETLFDIIYAANADAVTTASTSTFCTLSEFNILKERTVTTHAEGDSTSGDNQTIYGEKTFKDRVEFSDSSVTFRNYAYFAKDLKVYGTNTVSIGESAKPFKNIYVENLSVEDLSCESISATDNIVTTQQVECVGMNCSSDAHFTEDVYVDGGFEIHGNLEPDEDKTAQLGTYNYPFLYCYAGGLMITKEFASSSIGLAALEGSNSSYKITFGNSSPHQISVQSTNAYINISSTGVGSGCSFDITFASTKQLEIKYNSTSSQYETTLATPLSISGVLNCGGMKGTTATYSSPNTTVPIGGIFLGWVSDGYPGISGKAGEILETPLGQDYYIGFAASSGGTITSGNRPPNDGKYVALNDFDTSTGSVVLLQRIE